MNLWRRGSLMENPYHRTAFRVANVPPEVTRHRTLVQLIGETRRIVQADPQAHLVDGKPVTEAMMNQADRTLLDARLRIMEELLEHATERPPLEEVRKLAQEVQEALVAGTRDPLEIRHLSALAPWIETLAQQFLEAVPAGSVSFGALELTQPLPFGERPPE